MRHFSCYRATIYSATPKVVRGSVTLTKIVRLQFAVKKRARIFALQKIYFFTMSELGNEPVTFTLK